MKIRIFTALVALFGVSITANASVAILDKEVYHCSNGKDYGILRHYWGGWGPGNWNLVGLCSQSTLTQSHYDGRYTDARESHPDIARCADEDTPEIRYCYNEFTEKNGSRGVELTPIIQGRVVRTDDNAQTEHSRGGTVRQNQPGTAVR